MQGIVLEERESAEKGGRRVLRRELRLTGFYGGGLLIGCGRGLHFVEANGTLQAEEQCI